MAPKKAAAKGKAGKGKKESPRGGDASTNVENLTNEIADRDLRIQDLLLDIAREQERLGYTDAQNAKLSEKAKNCQDDLRNINEYLTKQLELSKHKSACLQSTVEQLQAKLELQAFAHKDALKQVYAEWAQDRSNVSEELAAMENEVEAGKAASAEKAELVSAVEAAQEHTAKARHECQLQIEELERQAAGFKERVRLHADQAMRECEERVRREALGKASQTFAEMSQALHKSHAELEQLAARTQELMDSQTTLRRDLDLSQGRETAHMRKTALLKRAIAILTARVKDAESQSADHAAGVADLREALAEAEAAAAGANALAAESAQEVAALKQELQSLRSAQRASLRRPTSAVKFQEPTSLDTVFQCINNVLYQRSRAAVSAQLQAGADESSQAGAIVDESASEVPAPTPAPGAASVYHALSAEECHALSQSLAQNAGDGTGVGSGLILTLPHPHSIPAYGHTNTSPQKSLSSTQILKLNLQNLHLSHPATTFSPSQQSSNHSRTASDADSVVSHHDESSQGPAADVAEALGEYLDAQSGEGAADADGKKEASQHAKLVRRLFSSKGKVSFALRDAEEVNKMIAHLTV